MFYISLPFFYQNQKFNDFFKKYVRNRDNKHKLKCDFAIEYIYGSFPWSYWNGGINQHSGPCVLYNQMHNLINSSPTALRIDASNLNLINTDYYDTKENITLSLIQNSCHVYEISNFQLMDYILTIDPYMHFIISPNNQILLPYTEETINAMTQKDNIELVSINNIKDFTFSNLINKNKIELIIGYCSNCTNEKQCQCINNENNNIYLYSGKSVYLNCPYGNKNYNYYEQIIPYYQQGFQHFKIIPDINNLENFNINIIQSFIKSEYVGECLIEYYKSK